MVPDRLLHPHPLITQSKAILEQTDPDRYRYLNILSSSWQALDIRVTKSNIGRALRFMDTLIKALESAGHTIELHHGKTYVRMSEDKFQIQFREKTKRVVIDPKKYGSTEYHPTGILAFQVHNWSDREFKDGRLMLEEQLPVILEHIEAVNQEWKAMRLAQRIKAAGQKEQERIVQDAEERKKTELVNFKGLLEKAERWHKADNLRRYIDEVGRRADTLDNEGLQSWLEWARQKADWYDPFVEREDALLKSVSREALRQQ